MIKMCRVGYKVGYYVNGYVKIDTKNGIFCIKYDQLQHDLIDDRAFDDKMDLYRRTLDYLRKPFYKSVVWDEKLLLRKLYGSRANWYTAVAHMLKFGILINNRNLLTHGEKP